MIIIELDVPLSFDLRNFFENDWAQRCIECLNEPFEQYSSPLE